MDYFKTCIESERVDRLRKTFFSLESRGIDRQFRFFETEISLLVDEIYKLLKDPNFLSFLRSKSPYISATNRDTPDFQKRNCSSILLLSSGEKSFLKSINAFSFYSRFKMFKR